MLSYQWNNQELAKKVFEILAAKGFNMWIDVQGGMHDNIYKSMAVENPGVENADAVVCFMSQEYQVNILIYIIVISKFYSLIRLVS